MGAVPCVLGHRALAAFCPCVLTCSLVSPNRGSSRSKQVFYNWLPDLYLGAIVLEFCQCQRQSTPSVGVPDDGIEGCLMKHRAIRAFPIIH
jgi:hypothetical protein